MYGRFFPGTEHYHTPRGLYFVSPGFFSVRTYSGACNTPALYSRYPVQQQIEGVFYGDETLSSPPRYIFASPSIFFKTYVQQYVKYCSTSSSYLVQQYVRSNSFLPEMHHDHPPPGFFFSYLRAFFSVRTNSSTYNTSGAWYNSRYVRTAEGAAGTAVGAVGAAEGIPGKEGVFIISGGISLSGFFLLSPFLGFQLHGRWSFSRGWTIVIPS